MQTNCKNCAATLTLKHYQDLLSCDYCNTVHVPSLREDALIERIEGVTSEAVCLVCTKQLHGAKLNDCKLLYCAGCKGLLIEQSDLLKLIKYVRAEYGEGTRVPERVPASDLERLVKCPDCSAAMTAHEYYGPGDFVIDSCSDCRKVWLDGGELARAASVKWGGSLWK